MQNIIDSILEGLDYFALSVYKLVLSGVATVINSLPVPDWASAVGGYASNISGSVMYFAAPFELNYGVGILVSAYGIRFLIRRLPVVG